MIRKKRLVAYLLLTVSLAACGKSTKFATTWTEPSAAPVDWSGQKVAAFVVSAHEATRLGAESTLARELTARGAQGVAGHAVVPGEVAQDKEKAKQMLEQAGITGAVVMRVVARDLEVYSSPGSVWYGTASVYPTFWGYWSYGWSAAYSPGYMSTEKVVSVETLVYSVDQDKLLWAGLSKTTNPKDVPRFIRNLCDAAGKEIRKAGLVKK